MTDAAFDKLAAMWRSGELNDEEFKLAKKYLREELAKTARSVKQAPQPVEQSSLFGSLARLILRVIPPRLMAGRLVWQRRIIEFVVLAVVGASSLYFIGVFGAMLIVESDLMRYVVGVPVWLTTMLLVSIIVVISNPRNLFAVIFCAVLALAFVGEMGDDRRTA